MDMDNKNLGYAAPQAANRTGKVLATSAALVALASGGVMIGSAGTGDEAPAVAQDGSASGQVTSVTTTAPAPADAGAATSMSVTDVPLDVVDSSTTALSTATTEEPTAPPARGDTPQTQTSTPPPERTSAPAGPAQPGQPTPGAMYTVAHGDTLSDISRDSGIPVHQIIDWNKIGDPDMIYAGTPLAIPSLGDVFPGH